MGNPMNEKVLWRLQGKVRSAVGQHDLGRDIEDLVGKVFEGWQVKVETSADRPGEGMTWDIDVWRQSTKSKISGDNDKRKRCLRELEKMEVSVSVSTVTDPSKLLELDHMQQRDVKVFDEAPILCAREM